MSESTGCLDRVSDLVGCDILFLLLKKFLDLLWIETLEHVLVDLKLLVELIQELDVIVYELSFLLLLGEWHLKDLTMHARLLVVD